MPQPRLLAPLLAALLTACGGSDNPSPASAAPRLLAATAASCPAWSTSQVYTAGMCAIHLGKQYQAKWWTQGNSPSATDTYGPWKYISDATDPPPNPDPGTQPGGVPTRAQAEAREADLTNSDFFRKVKATIRTLDNPAVEAVTPGAAANPANVRRVERLLPSAKWDFYFGMREPSYTYRRFLQAVAKFPAVCDDYTDGRNADSICRHTLATMFAHFAQETGDHNASVPLPQWRQGLKYLREIGCDDNGSSCGYNTECADPVFNAVWTCGKNADGSYKKYFGRGAKQLSYNYNYGPFSQVMYGGDQSVLLKEPDLVASTWLNLASATFFFVYPQPPKPSMLHVIDGTWVPNAADAAAGAGNNFATTIMIINAECGTGTEKPAAQNRIDYYRQFAADLGWNTAGEQLSCATMQRFGPSSSAAYSIYWEKNWNSGGDYQCQLVSYQTPYSALIAGNYARCVEKNWSVVLK
ncbi:chitinase [Massilia sp. Root418]|uniref:glycoside hydrolase family 19 protein n=1 Tax=Massilia sp. Root418 TaxID=1736532 RepID=UPI0006FA488F|nr:glycoside hydrolase family 19 protein [Massilia sp. Root418]KQW94013.1 chitinase [Massilia sp. Root418]